MHTLHSNQIHYPQWIEASSSNNYYIEAYKFLTRPLGSNRYLLIASISTQVVAEIFSLIIKSSAELKTVFNIWACNPLK